MTLLTFPSFNLFSMPLLILVLQGYIFAFLLLRRYWKTKHFADLFLALLLLITGFHRTTYIIGFMDWYDTFRNTKVNYFLLDFSLALGPLLYLYIRSITQPYLKFRRQDLWHFLPVTVTVIVSIFIGVYDAFQPGFENVQNGVLKQGLEMEILSPYVNMIDNISQILYFAFAIQTYWFYREKIRHYFSNTYKIELKWIRNFLIAYVALFVFQLFISVTNNAVVELHWQQRWWGHLVGALVMMYVGMMAYFTDFTKLYQLTFDLKPPKTSIGLEQEVLPQVENWKQELLAYMEDQKPYLNPDLTLHSLAKMLNVSSNQLSQTINIGTNKNFKDFINKYRVKAVQDMLISQKKEQLTLLGIAFECGFNSKATFNRTFKKFTELTPSEYVATLSSQLES